jgi:hypothetical protein
MKFYGSGTVCYPGTSRVIHDFEDGPFETINEVVITHCKAIGLATEPPVKKPLGRPRKDGNS